MFGGYMLLSVDVTKLYCWSSWHLLFLMDFPHFLHTLALPQDSSLMSILFSSGYHLCALTLSPGWCLLFCFVFYLLLFFCLFDFGFFYFIFLFSPSTWLSLFLPLLECSALVPIGLCVFPILLPGHPSYIMTSNLWLSPCCFLEVRSLGLARWLVTTEYVGVLEEVRTKPCRQEQGKKNSLRVVLLVSQSFNIHVYFHKFIFLFGWIMNCNTQSEELPEMSFIQCYTGLHWSRSDFAWKFSE